MNPEHGEYSKIPDFEPRAFYAREFYPGEGFDIEEKVNSGGIHYIRQNTGEGIYFIHPTIDDKSLSILRAFINYPDRSSLTSEQIQNLLPTCVVTSTTVAYLLKGEPRILINENGVNVRDKDLHDKAYFQRNFQEGQNPVFCNQLNARKYRYQMDSVITTPIFEVGQDIYGVHLTQGAEFNSLRHAAIRSDLDTLRKNNILTDKRVRDMIDPFFDIEFVSLRKKR